MRRVYVAWGAPAGVFPYISHAGMCGPKGYSFLASLACNRVRVSLRSCKSARAWAEETTYSTSPLTNIFDIYGLRQLITEPTRVTPTSQTLIDLCITNACDKVINSGVLPLGISDHYLVYMTRKAHYDRTGPRTIETRQFKIFQKGKLFV